MSGFRLFGGIEADIGGGLVQLGPLRQRTVLAALLMDAGRTVPIDELADRVWGDRQPQRARETLYSYVSRLRRAFRGAGPERRGGGYAVAVGELAVDVRLFRDLLRRARAADDETAVVLFREAFALWQGEPFAGVDTPWFNAAREGLVLEREVAESDCVERRLRLGEHAALLPLLSERSAARPLDERIAGQYMLVLHRTGRQADALAHYLRVRATLAEELGIDPGHELRGLHAAMLTGEPLLAAPVGSDWTVQRQLPMGVPGFVGRTGLVRRLASELAVGADAPVVLWGSPGVGKSALAVQLGHRVREAFPDGQWYVRLSGNSARPRDPGEVLAALLRASGQRPGDIPELLDDRAAAFRSRLAGRRVLLVLDEAADAEQVRPLLPGTQGVAVLVTSRSDLRGLVASHAARTTFLEVFAPAEARQLLADAVGARQVEDEPAAADRVAELCAYLPLALRIAGVNLAARPGRSLGDCARELAGDGRLAKLSVPGDPHAAVRTAFDRSHATLAPDAARLFALLALHPGPDFTVEATAALLDAPVGVASRLLDALVTAALVQRTAGNQFRFHDLLRLYAAEHCDAVPDLDAARRRLCGATGVSQPSMPRRPSTAAGTCGCAVRVRRPHASTAGISS
ncbi:BTAD domain-containing putative transcriptional regulator [Streptomyces sp. NPDC086835]|uniref:AfsR/SARP family transcriptional regulator n=1 Tax=Streptomyces sp. NPDC086835 TaxID=3365761 RepID=UPI003804B449